MVDLNFECCQSFFHNKNYNKCYKKKLGGSFLFFTYFLNIVTQL